MTALPPLYTYTGEVQISMNSEYMYLMLHRKRDLTAEQAKPGCSKQVYYYHLFRCASFDSSMQGRKDDLD